MNPVDGVEGFENLRQYGISLALLDNGKVVYQSVTSSLMIAVAAILKHCPNESHALADHAAQLPRVVHIGAMDSHHV